MTAGREKLKAIAPNTKATDNNEKATGNPKKIITISAGNIHSA
ncbi:uncharacterized protein METZ01_LOCUS251391, partial [marine metagenome]